MLVSSIVEMSPVSFTITSLNDCLFLTVLLQAFLKIVENSHIIQFKLLLASFILPCDLLFCNRITTRFIKLQTYEQASLHLLRLFLHKFP